MGKTKVFVSVFYGTTTGVKKSVIQVYSDDSVNDLRSQIVNAIPEFAHIKPILVTQRGMNQIILNNLQSVDDITMGKINKFDIRAYPEKVKCVVKTANKDPQEVIFDVTQPPLVFINQLVEENPERYVLYYQDPQDSAVLLCCSALLPLCVQGWLHDPLVLLRRIYPADLTETTDPNFRQILHRNFRLAALWGLSYYPVDVWAQLTALQFIYENVSKLDMNYIKENVTRCVSRTVEVDNMLCSKISKYIIQDKCFDEEQASTMYLQIAATNGCQCAFIEKVRVNVVRDKKFRLPKWKVLYVSGVMALLLNDDEKSVFEEVKTEEIKNVTIHSAITQIILKDGQYWEIISQRPFALRDTVLGSIGILADVEKQSPHQQQEVEQEEQKEATQTVPPSTQGESKHSSHSGKLGSKGLLLKQNSSSRISSHFLLEEHEDQFINSGKKKRSKMMPIGLSPLVLPPFTDDTDYDYIKENVPQIEIVKHLSPDEIQLNETENIKIDFDDFFDDQVSSSLFTNPVVILGIIVIIVNIWKLARKLKGWNN